MSSTPDPPGSRDRTLPWRALVVAVVVLVVGVLPLAGSLLDRRDERLATNTRLLGNSSWSAIEPGARECADTTSDDALALPEGATGVEMFVRRPVRPAPRLSVTVTGRRASVRGTAAASTPEGGGPVLVELDRDLPASMRRICVRNVGAQRVELARSLDAGGNGRTLLTAGKGANEPEREARPTLRFDLIGRQDAVAGSLLGRGLDHATAFKPDGVGPLVILGGLVLVLFGGGAGLVLVARTPSDPEPSGGTDVPRAAGPLAGPDGRRGGW
ncbi:hypothetical protein [Patulibacter sp.]|uniref:hypothetical protein n=1 Tax=Patulibacter sp. TaxID=1912859 RepID=UPI0027234C43|nr:hypothetical protein [Patulibacter sp.]MDO9408783.1 hypothetical protein [Patulibacter sp.]